MNSLVYKSKGPFLDFLEFALHYKRAVAKIRCDKRIKNNKLALLS